jgi:hypothetical protein
MVKLVSNRISNKQHTKKKPEQNTLERGFTRLITTKDRSSKTELPKLHSIFPREQYVPVSETKNYAIDPQQKRAISLSTSRCIHSLIRENEKTKPKWLDVVVVDPSVRERTGRRIILKRRQTWNTRIGCYKLALPWKRGTCMRLALGCLASVLPCDAKNQQTSRSPPN